MREKYSPTVKKIQLYSTIILIGLYLLAGVTVVWSLSHIWEIIASPVIDESIIVNFVESYGLVIPVDQLAKGMFTAREKWVVIIFTGAYCAFLVYISLVAGNLFRNFRKGLIFTLESVHYAKRCGYLSLVFFALPVLTPLYLKILTGNEYYNIPGNMPNVIAVGMIWICVWILEIGTELNSDDELTV